MVGLLMFVSRGQGEIKGTQIQAKDAWTLLIAELRWAPQDVDPLMRCVSHSQRSTTQARFLRVRWAPPWIPSVARVRLTQSRKSLSSTLDTRNMVMDIAWKLCSILVHLIGTIRQHSSPVTYLTRNGLRKSRFCGRSFTKSDMRNASRSWMRSEKTRSSSSSWQETTCLSLMSITRIRKRFWRCEAKRRKWRRWWNR